MTSASATAVTASRLDTRTPPVAVSLEGLEKRFGDVVAVDGVDLDILDGEFFSLLGPSGSGKTTTLRMIAGFDRPTAGRVRLHGRDVTALAPFERDVNTVFQDYALFPHMSVAQNVAYGLMVRRVPREQRKERVSEALRRVRLPGFESRRPAQLSGGQRQRVALARALVNRPRVVLLDEPLGALDRKLREQMQVELKEIQRSVGITFVFVTHDQDEALSMSDRVAVFDSGRLAQVGTPSEIYERPATPFVAGFVGTSNVIEGPLAQRLTDRSGQYSVRPEKIRILAAGESAAPDEHSVAGSIREVIYLGASTRVVVSAEHTNISVLRQNAASALDESLSKGEPVRIAWKKAHMLSLHSDDAEEPAH